MIPYEPSGDWSFWLHRRNIVKMLMEEGNTVGTYNIRDKTSVSGYHIKSDVCNLKMLEKILSGTDHVFHLAAVTSPPEFKDLTREGYEDIVSKYNVLEQREECHTWFFTVCIWRYQGVCNGIRIPCYIFQLLSHDKEDK